MNFYGILYTEKIDKKGLFSFHYKSPSSDKEFIKTDNYKKYYVWGKWVISCDKDYLSKIDIRRYINRSDTFLKLILSSDTQTLKYDLIEKRFLIKQIIIKNGQLMGYKGVDQTEINGRDVLNVLEAQLQIDFSLKADDLIPKDCNYVTFKSLPEKFDVKQGLFDYYTILSIPKALVFIVISLYNLIVLFKFLFNQPIFENGVFQVGVSITIIGLIYFGFLPVYLTYLAIKEIRNYLAINNRVCNDEIIKNIPRP